MRQNPCDIHTVLAELREKERKEGASPETQEALEAFKNAHRIAEKMGLTIIVSEKPNWRNQ